MKFIELNFNEISYFLQDEPRSPHYVHEKFPVVEKKADLFTIAGLEPSYSDLDQIFDNSDSSGDDEIVS